MVTLTTPLDLTQLDEELFPMEGEFHHGAHFECQVDNPQVTTVCGIVDDWTGWREIVRLPKCPKCFADDARCPVCGIKLIPGD